LEDGVDEKTGVREDRGLEEKGHEDKKEVGKVP